MNGFKKISESKLIAAYSFNNCMNYYNFKDKRESVIFCINSKSPSLGTLIREKSKDFAIKFINSWINEIKEYDVDINDVKMNYISKTIVDQYYNLKISDLTYLFKNIIQNGFDNVSKILTDFYNYFEYRCKIGAELSRLHLISSK